MAPTMQGPDAPEARANPGQPREPTGNPLYDAILAGRERGDGRLFEPLADGVAERDTLDDAAFLDLAGRYARVLADAGAGPGERVAV